MRATLFVLAVCALASVASAQTAPEFRGVWVSRFEWPSPDQAQCKAKIDEVMKTLAEHNFNAVIFQMRGECDTLYPSPEEPLSPIISPNGAKLGWDPMAYAIQAAHAHHLEFHAYINTHVAWQSGRHEPPADKSHIFFKHFDASSPSTCDWLVHDAEGKPAHWGSSDYVWIAPGVPAAQAYTRRQVMYVVSKYDVDGVHFDRIRTYAPDLSHDPISMSRLQTGVEGNPAKLDFGAWTNDQITRFLCDLYAQIAEVKPQMKVSSAPLGLVSIDRYPQYRPGFEYALTKCHQDAQAWLAAGAMDFIMPQIYWSDHDQRKPDFSEVLPDWMAHTSGRYVCPGQTVGEGVNELMSQVRITRKSGGAGNVIFSYGGFKRAKGFEAYSRPGGVYASPAPTPPVPWKEHPTEGIILGNVVDADSGEAVVDAQIRRNGSEYVALSSADGIYSFLKVPPGKYTLTVRKQGKPEQQADVVVAAGQVSRADIKLGEKPVTVVASAERKEETPELKPEAKAEVDAKPAVQAKEPAPEPKTVADAPEGKTAAEAPEETSAKIDRTKVKVPVPTPTAVVVIDKPADSSTFKYAMIVVMLVGVATLGIGLAWHFGTRKKQ